MIQNFFFIQTQPKSFYELQFTIFSSSYYKTTASQVTNLRQTLLENYLKHFFLADMLFSESQE